ncbi:hypothetical protein [Nocardia sp. NPDC049149]|uniref:hypothetical protein n=1 Tax=Nocardia sp. NPDC049149 TaxID=3364315 RepID=UPI00371ED2EB
MTIVMELHCPLEHGSAEEAGPKDISPTRPSLGQLAGMACPACPTLTLEPGLTMMGGNSVTTGYCPCCHATWLPAAPMHLLAAGRLVGVEYTAGQSVSS